MGSWDELCLLCGICPAGGPAALLSRYDLQNLTGQITAEVKTDITNITDDDLLSIVSDALSSSFSDDDRKLDYRPTWLPVGLGQCADRTQSTCVAIGYFDEQEGEAPVREGKIPDGRNVEVRRVRNTVGGDFGAVVRTIVHTADEEEMEEGEQEEEEDDEDWVEEVEEDRPSACSVAEVNHPNNPNFWLCERCYNHLNAWLEVESLPPPLRSEPESLAGELYEIVNSRAQRRTDSNTGLLPCIDYDGIEETLVQWQILYAPGRRGSQNIAHGIRAGRRGADLISDIMRDFRCWMFMQPDIWPEPTNSLSPVFTTYDNDPMGPVPVIATLPIELLIPISHELPVQELLALSSTCKSLRALITDPSFLNRVFRDALLHGSLRYILPVTPEETSKADDIAEQWLSKGGNPSLDADVMNFAMPFAYPKFPYVKFLRACFGSDSMRNRKRIWGLVQQFRQLWREYRTKGWEVDRFYSSDEIPASSRLFCHSGQCPRADGMHYD